MAIYIRLTLLGVLDFSHVLSILLILRIVAMVAELVLPFPHKSCGRRLRAEVDEDM